MERFLNPDSGDALSGVEIERMCRHRVERERGDGLHIGPSSLDLHVAPEKVFVVGGSNNDSGTTFNVGREETHPETRREEQDPIVIEPGEFCLARTDEVFDLPYGIMAFMDGRSSVGRLGLFVENAGLVDRGFSGTLTMELFNPTKNEIHIPAQTRLAQLSFFRQGGSKETSYNGKYQGQHDATASRLHDDPDLE